MFNEWTIAHVASGVLWGMMKPGAMLTGVAAHTAYEMVEGNIFPRDDRDVSMRNHLGDTLAFVAGMLLGSGGKR